MFPNVEPCESEPASPERGAWDGVRQGWRQLYGSFDRLGVSVEMHDFRVEPALDWGRSFHPNSLEICFNLAGRGAVIQGRKTLNLSANAVGFYGENGCPLDAQRSGGELHRFATFEFSREFLMSQFAECEDALDPAIRAFVTRGKTGTVLSQAQSMTPSQSGLVPALCAPPVASAARNLWFQSKILEVAAECFFPKPTEELFCTRQKRLAQERAERTAAILRSRMEAPPSLDELGREVGVSPFYLSRIFSEEMRATIPQYLRRIRMERAAELLRAGTHNVTEAAFAVGYSSLGHFSKSFCEVIGCCPTLYPHARHLMPRQR